MLNLEIAKASALAEKEGFAKFISIQGYYNLIFREEEREMVPYCEEENIALTPYSALASGRLSRKPGENDTKRAAEDAYAKFKYDATADQDNVIISLVTELSEKRGVTMTELSLAWLLTKVTAPEGAYAIGSVDERSGIYRRCEAERSGHELEKKYDANDAPHLIKNFNKYSEEIREIIYKKIKNPTSTIKNYIADIASDKKLIYKIFGDDDISTVDKTAILDLLITDKADVDLEILLQKMGFTNMIKLVSGDTSRLPQIKNGAEEQGVLSLLKKHGYIEGFSIDKDSIKVERKKVWHNMG